MSGSSWPARMWMSLITAALLCSCAAEKKETAALDGKLKPYVATLEARRTQANQLIAKLAVLNDSLRSNNKHLQQLNKDIPKLTAQSDAALRQSKQYKISSAHAPNQKSKLSLKEKAEQQQKLANERAAQLLVAREDITVTQSKIRSLKTQINQLTAQKQTAIRLAKVEADKINRLKRAAETKVTHEARNDSQKEIAGAGNQVKQVSRKTIDNRNDIAHRGGGGTKKM
jgi:hypothetical protein